MSAVVYAVVLTMCLPVLLGVGYGLGRPREPLRWVTWAPVTDEQRLALLAREYNTLVPLRPHMSVIVQ